MRIPRTCRVREATLKAYYYLRATFKIESKESESFVFEQIILDGIEKVEELAKEGKTVIISSFRGKRYVIGGNLTEETNNLISGLCEKYNWQIQECIEILIYFSSMQRFNEEEKVFFGLHDMKIAIL
ncbi:MAG: hypothetical protein Q8934_08965 [Bacillota bacterium]|nr:hypothetical protein [Bacillota bacterium]